MYASILLCGIELAAAHDGGFLEGSHECDADPASAHLCPQLLDLLTEVSLGQCHDRVHVPVLWQVLVSCGLEGQHVLAAIPFHVVHSPAHLLGHEDGVHHVLRAGQVLHLLASGDGNADDPLLGASVLAGGTTLQLFDLAYLGVVGLANDNIVSLAQVINLCEEEEEGEASEKKKKKTGKRGEDNFFLKQIILCTHQLEQGQQGQQQGQQGHQALYACGVCFLPWLVRRSDGPFRADGLMEAVA